MAISGTFTADFSQFQTAVQNADVRLKAFESSSNKVETSLSRMTNSFTGTKVIAEAALMAEAVERIGGVSRLTESELKRVGATAQEAAAKMRAWGQDVPPQIQKLADSVKDTSNKTSGLAGSLSTVNGLLGAFGLAMSAAGVVRFVGSVFDAASQIHDMSLKLGISTDAIQGFKYAAEQGGSSIEAVGTAITKMNDNLVEGKKGTIEALNRVGLEFDTIRRMKPEDAFLAITDAIAEIEDPMVRSQVALEIFGKSAADLLPAIQEGFRKTSDSASKMSEETIKSLEQAEDAWERLYNKVVIVTGTIIGKVFEMADRTRAAMENMGSPSLWDRFMQNLGILTQQTLGVGDAMTFLSDVALPKLPPAAALAVSAGFNPAIKQGAELERTIKTMNATLGYTPTALGLVEPKVGTLSDVTRNLAKYTEEASRYQGLWNTGLRFTSTVIDDAVPKIEKMAGSVRKATDELKAANTEASKFAPGSVGLNLGNISFAGGLEAAFKRYSQMFSQSGVGAIGGGPAPDFVSWALTNGLATRGGAPTAASNVNINGILMGSDPAALQQLRDLVDQALRQSLGPLGRAA